MSIITEDMIRLLTPQDQEWPTELLDRIDSEHRPTELWVLGASNLRELTRDAVAVLGARASTAYGEHVSAQLGIDLAKRGTTVINGGSLGCEAQALRGALSVEGRTIAMMPGGLDQLYPSGNSKLFDQVVAGRGMLISQFAPGTLATRDRLLERAQVLGALASSVVVVEAADRSCAAHAAAHSRIMGIPVYAVPGPVTSSMSVGTHKLIQTGAAQLCVSAADIPHTVQRSEADLSSTSVHPSVAHRLDISSERIAEIQTILNDAGDDWQRIAATLPEAGIIVTDHPSGNLAITSGIWAGMGTPLVFYRQSVQTEQADSTWSRTGWSDTSRGLFADRFGQSVEGFIDNALQRQDSQSTVPWDNESLPGLYSFLASETQPTDEISEVAYTPPPVFGTPQVSEIGMG